MTKEELITLLVTTTKVGVMLVIVVQERGLAANWARWIFRNTRRPWMAGRELMEAVTALILLITKNISAIASVQILVNEEKKRILIRPIASSEPYAINWIRDTERPASRPIECSAFTRPMFRLWQFEKRKRYRAMVDWLKMGKSR